MVGNPTVKTLGEIAENVSRPFDFSKYEDVVFINTGDVLDGYFTKSKPETKVGLPGQAKKAIEEGDILLSEIRPGNGRFAKVDFDSKNYVVSTKFMVIRLKEKGIDPAYFYKVLTSKDALNEFQRIAESRSGTFPQVTFDAISHYPISVPGIDEQRWVADLINQLDGKIELNRQINATLESMAQTLFKSWFVDFDPVIDNALAAGNPIPEPLQARTEKRAALLAAASAADTRSASATDNARPTQTAPHTQPGTTPPAAPFQPLPVDLRAYFPDSFVFNEEMGWVPEGWGAGPVYEVAKFINGAAFKGKDFSIDRAGLPVVKIAEAKNGISSQTKFTEKTLDAKYRIDDSEILFSWSGNPDTSIDTFVWTHGPGWLNQHIFKVSLHSRDDREFVYYLLKSLKPVFSEIARDKQTTGLGHVTAGDMKRLFVISPQPDVARIFRDMAAPIFDRWYSGLLEIRQLAELRDILLPKLLSGKIKLAEAETLVTEAL